MSADIDLTASRIQAMNGLSDFYDDQTVLRLRILRYEGIMFSFSKCFSERLDEGIRKLESKRDHFRAQLKEFLSVDTILDDLYDEYDRILAEMEEVEEDLDRL